MRLHLLLVNAWFLTLPAVSYAFPDSFTSTNAIPSVSSSALGSESTGNQGKLQPDYTNTLSRIIGLCCNDVVTYRAIPGELNASFSILITNCSENSLIITELIPSCGCTTTKLPQQPWKLAPKDFGPIGMLVDLRGKSGILSKTVTILSPSGYKDITVNVLIPQSENSKERDTNQEMARADRQAVFKSDCARCHIQPTKNVSAELIYQGMCGICHEAKHRASMVPNLRISLRASDRQYWSSWTTYGREGSLMPAFGLKGGGPLTDSEINLLVDFLTSDSFKQPEVKKSSEASEQFAIPDLRKRP